MFGVLTQYLIQHHPFISSDINNGCPSNTSFHVISPRAVIQIWRDHLDSYADKIQIK